MIRVRGQDRHSIVPAAYLICEQDSKVLLIRRLNTGYFDGHYGLPSGHIEADEGPIAAAVREALEEVGLRVLPQDLEIAHIMHRKAEGGDHERVDFYFRARTWKGEPINKEPSKCDELGWFRYDDLPKNMVPVVRQVLKYIAEGTLYSEWR